MIYTKKEVKKIQSEWEERSRKYKSRKFDNANQQAVEDYLVSGLVAWGEVGIGAYHKLILEKGQWFVGRQPVDNYQECKDFRKRHRPKIKQCFYNSQMFISTYNAGKYYEGYMCDGFFTVMHGWVVMPEGVVDFTLEARDRKLKRSKMSREGISAKDVAYLGVEIPREFLKNKIVELRACTAIAHMFYLNDHRQIWMD